MLHTSKILATLSEQYVHASKHSGGEYRLVMPGLTPKIGEEVHQRLLDSNIASFLVIGGSREPDQEKKWLLPVSLTSMRIGSFAAVCDPGALADVQDSIRGSGGTIRSCAFSEEWPWIDNGSESFLFNGPFLERLLSQWDIERNDRPWFQNLITKVLLESTRRRRDRSPLLLESILGRFFPADIEISSSTRDKFLFHCGIPLPDDTSSDPARIAARLRRHLVRPIFDRVRNEEDVREQVLGNIADDEPDRDRLMAAIVSFIDGLSRTTAADTDILAFRDCWGGGQEAIDNWQLLTMDRLCRLFEIQERPPVDLSANIDELSGTLTSQDAKKAALSAQSSASLSITYQLSEDELAQSTCRLELSIRNRTLKTLPLTESKDSFSLTVPSLESVGLSYRSRVPVRIAVFIDDEVRAEARVYLHCYGEQRKAFVVTTPQFWVDDARNVSKDDSGPEQRHLVDGPVRMHVFSHLPDQPYIVCNETDEQLVEKNGVWLTPKSLDVFGEVDAQLLCQCHVGEHWVSITYEAEDIERGEFTLEDELRRSIASGSSNRVSEILAIHTGKSRSPYSRLGQLSDRSRQLIRMAATQECKDGWKPLLLDFNGDLGGAVKACGDYCHIWGGTPNVEAFATMQLPKRLLELIQTYSDARESVRQNVLNSLDISSRSGEHPEYALFPIYRDTGPDENKSLESAIERYLLAYCSILTYQKCHFTELLWEHAFVLTHLDCVIHWADDHAKNNVFLLGPWHPLVVAKRYMIQHALVLRGQRLVAHKCKRFSKLVNLLSFVNGFSWHPCLKAEDVSFEIAHVVPTSDPGWHLAFKRRAADNGDILSHVTDQLHSYFGLECSISAPTSGGMVGTVLSSFLRTFPSKRHVGIYFPEGFQGLQETSSIDKLLHFADEPTAAGHQLTGGVALCFQQAPELPADSTWTNPSLQVFRYPEWDECASERNPDIRFCPPDSGLKFLEANTYSELPRGEGTNSVFSQPLSRCTQGQAFLPQSVTEGWDSEQQSGVGVGPAFIGACGLSSSISDQHFGVVDSVGLPKRLESYWTVVPGAVLDPAVFVQYVKEGNERSIETRALWDYHISLSSGPSSFFVLSTIPASYRSAVNGIFEGDVDQASTFVSELGQVGLAIAGEAMKSGRHALGTIGLVGAVRLFTGSNVYSGPLEWSHNHIGFLLPVDSFAELFESKPNRTKADKGASRQRADLLAVSVVIPDDSSQLLTIQSIAVECKFSSGTYPSANVSGAIEQARITANWFEEICTLAQRNDGVAERLGLLQMLWFGTRISGSNCKSKKQLEACLYKAVLSGKFEFRPAKRSAVLVSTEIGLSGSAEMSFPQDGAWFRINQRNWPGISETSSVQKIRKEIMDLFDHAPQHNSTFREAADDLSPVTTKQSFRRDPTQQPTTDTAEAEAQDRIELNGEDPDPPSDSNAVKQGAQSETDVDEEYLEDIQLEGISIQKILVGVDSARRDVYFDPHSPVDRLDNVNTMITGSSGKGKTQFLKYMLSALRDQGAHVLILDFKNDFANDTHFTERADIESVIVTFDGLPFNPLIPYPISDPRSGQLFIQCAQHITGLASVLRRTYGLGAQQEAAVKKALRDAFSEAGVNPTSTVPYDSNMKFPDLARVGDILEETNPSAYNRLDPLFTLDLFKEKFCRTSFAQLVSRSTVMDLSQIPSDPLKNALAELIVLSAHSYYNSQPHCGSLRQVVAVDEAHRILQADFVERFALECRAYGVCLMLSSQYPSQFPSDVRDCMATKIIHGNDRDVDRVKDIVNFLDCRGRESEIADLGMFEAVYSNKHFRNVCIRTITYPIDLVLSALRQCPTEELSHEEIGNIPGLDTKKLSIGNIIQHLERLGLAEGTNGSVRLLSRNG